MTGWLAGIVSNVEWLPAFSSGPPHRRRSVASETIIVTLEDGSVLPFYEESMNTKPRFKVQQEVRANIFNGSIVEVRAPLEGGKVLATPLELLKQS